jgi:D-glycero-D-manno-heptose 1,7-bisphosphate phosphatase
MSGRPAVFLDRDGTLIEDRHYLRDPTGVQLLPGAAEAVRRLNAAGRVVVVVTNQSGIARGLLTEADYAATSRRLAELLAAGGAQLDAQYHCPHHPDLSGACECRKPGTLLYRRAAADFGLDLGRSWWIGDRLRDVAAAGALGGRGLLVRTGRGGEEARRPEATLWPTTRDLRSAVGLVLSERGVPDYFPRP